MPPKMIAAQKQEFQRSKTRRRTNVLIIPSTWTTQTGHVMKVPFLSVGCEQAIQDNPGRG